MQLTRNRYLKHTLSALLIISGLWFLGQGGYIHAKAWLAQYLLDQSWTAIRQGESQVKPWPWADTWPIARLSVPRLDISLLVLAGDNGRTLAFGPGHNFSSALPGSNGNSIISAHRDTHFKFLQHLKINDEIIIETVDRKRIYKVDFTRVVHRDKARFPVDDTKSFIHLVTCYPFNAVTTGGSDRFILSASAR